MFYGTAAVSAEPQNSNPPAKVIVADDRNIVDGVALIANSGNRKNVEASVREYFKDTPILAEIAKCESRFRQVDENGDVVRGEINRSDIGVMQINTYYHADTAKKLGLDLKTLGGNMAYAKYLYEKEGSTPWLSSSGCWNKFKSLSQK